MKTLSNFVLVAGVSVAGLIACGGDDNNATYPTADMSTVGMDMNLADLDLDGMSVDMPGGVDMSAREDMPADIGGGVNADMTTEVDAGDGECTADYECAEDQVCDQALKVCEFMCTGGSDCLASEACIPRPGDVGTSICRVKEPDCMSNDECTAGDDGMCVDGECEYSNPSTAYQWIMILDESFGDAACNQTDPGSDIMGVRVLDGTGQLLGWGSAGNEAQGDSGNQFNRYDTSIRLDGTSNGFAGRSCPDAGTRLSELMPPPLSLGCGGWVLIEFISAVGDRVEITDGLRIEVLEYGPTCGGSSDDSYSVYLCTDGQGAEGGDDTSCTLGVGGVQGGFSSVEVSL